MRETDLQNRLNRFSSHLLGQSAAASDKPTANTNLPARYSRIATALAGASVERRGGTFCQIDSIYSREYEHGALTVSGATGIDAISAAALTREKSEQSIPLEQLRFVDTETTGLGGSGTIPFLIGVARIQEGAIYLRQFFLPDYSDEAGMLEAVAEELQGEISLVSYNGLSFDLPVMQSRCIVNRIHADFTERAHFDLLYPTRRLFKRRLRDCSLQNIERMVLGFERHDDIPGYLIPSSYFEWLSEEQTDDMQAVVEHNKLDIVSLVFLAAFYAEVFATEGEPLDEIDDLHSLSRTYSARGEREIAHKLFMRLESESPGALAEDVILFHAANCRRLGDYESALRLWQSIVDSDSRIGGLANIELSKYYEHVAPDFPAALRFARAAANKPLTRSQTGALEKRLFRLESRLGRELK